MEFFYKNYEKLDWLADDAFRPYVLMRNQNRIKKPWIFYHFKDLEEKTYFVDPLLMENVSFTNAILDMESSAFHLTAMNMPRWTFYDCGIMPGLCSGFVCHKDRITKNMRKSLRQGIDDIKGDWVPISLFAALPCVEPTDWVAHNLSSINPAIPKEERIFGLGFLTKAFGLAYANISHCYGVTQWDSASVPLHSYFGAFEIVTSYTPSHTYPKTLTYRLKVEPEKWHKFFSREITQTKYDIKKTQSFELDVRQLEELISFQKRLEVEKGPFFIDSFETRQRQIGAPYIIYQELQD